MTRIDASQALAALMQPKRTERSGGRNQTKDNLNIDQAQDQLACGQTLKASVALRVRAIDAKDPDRRKKAFRIFLEENLLVRLGKELINDPAFYRLVEEVEDCMHQNAKLQGALMQASDELLRQAEVSHHFR